jgi:carboxyl-terminal processing protease
MNNIFSRKAYSFVLIGILLGASFFIGVYTGYSRVPEINKVQGLENKEVGKPEQVDFSMFWKAWNILSEKYVSPTEGAGDQEKVYGAIKGLADSLGDPYTVFFPPVESKMFEEEISGNFEGVGMEVGMEDNVLTVIAPLKSSPAERAGVLSGDKIIEIDGTITQGLSIDEAVKKIRGAKGTAVGLTLIREGRKEPLKVSITRDVIRIPTIDTKQLPGNIFLISLYNFSEGSPALFRNALSKFISSGSNKLILDLRGNPGGYLEAAVDMASWFLPQGKVIVTEDFGNNQKPVVYRSKGYNVFNTSNLEFVILIDGGSASASEILAGALQEHGVAKLVGAKTFGKGSVQELIKLSPDTSLKITRWLTPQGKSISDGGLAPDIEVRLTPEDIEKRNDLQLNRAIEMLSDR